MKVADNAEEFALDVIDCVTMGKKLRVQTDYLALVAKSGEGAVFY